VAFIARISQMLVTLIFCFDLELLAANVRVIGRTLFAEHGTCRSSNRVEVI